MLCKLYSFDHAETIIIWWWGPSLVEYSVQKKVNSAFLQLINDLSTSFKFTTFETDPFEYCLILWLEFYAISAKMFWSQVFLCFVLHNMYWSHKYKYLLNEYFQSIMNEKTILFKLYCFCSLASCFIHELNSCFTVFQR